MGGQPRTLDMREVYNASFYLLRNSYQWRDLPHDFSKWPSVYAYCRTWCRDGTWQRRSHALTTPHADWLFS